MKCAKCGNELKDGRLYCEHCGEEIKIVPEFDLEFEKQIKETLDNLAKDVVSETEEPTQEDVFQKIDQEDIDFHDSLKDIFSLLHFKNGRMIHGKFLIALVAGIIVFVVGCVLLFRHTSVNSY